MPTRSKATGPQSLTGSPDARRLASVLLEVLSGVKTAQEGSESLGISVARYYQLETRALQGFVTALEPVRKGRQVTAERKLELMTSENVRLKRDVSRYQSLLRAAQRSLGVRPRKRAKLASTGKASKKRRRATTVRATKAIAALAKPDAETGASS